MSSSTLLWRQVRAAFLPLIAAIACFVVVALHSGGMEGSAVSGYVQDGKYFLSLGHGGHVETTRNRFEEIRHREKIIYAWMGGMILSIAVAVIVIKLAGLPLELRKDERSIRTLHPPPGSRGPEAPRR
jgi:hypothetical protein